jgi:hypothetical protein
MASSHDVARGSKCISLANVNGRADRDRENILDESWAEDESTQPIESAELRDHQPAFNPDSVVGDGDGGCCFFKARSDVIRRP